MKLSHSVDPSAIDECVPPPPPRACMCRMYDWRWATAHNTTQHSTVQCWVKNSSDSERKHDDYLNAICQRRDVNRSLSEYFVEHMAIDTFLLFTPITVTPSFISLWLCFGNGFGFSELCVAAVYLLIYGPCSMRTILHFFTCLFIGLPLIDLVLLKIQTH